MSQLNPQGSLATATARARVRVKQTILIAEDSNDAREAMGMLLRLKGYKVLSAENGLRAVEVALTGRPDLILLDLELPRLDGLGVVRILRSHREFRDTPIIIVSGHDPAQHLQPAIDAGCSDYLLKPIDFERLDKILKSTVAAEPGAAEHDRPPHF
jgi:CheY-like chemotaxis protein